MPERKTFEELMAIPAVDEDGDEDLTVGLDSLYDLEIELRKLDLAQIGYLFLSQIGEANHGHWDSVPREELIGINNFFHDMIFAINHEELPKENLELFFGGREQWDAQGKRHNR